MVIKSKCFIMQEAPEESPHVTVTAEDKKQKKEKKRKKKQMKAQQQKTKTIEVRK